MKNTKVWLHQGFVSFLRKRKFVAFLKDATSIRRLGRFSIDIFRYCYTPAMFKSKILLEISKGLFNMLRSGGFAGTKRGLRLGACPWTCQ